MKIDSYRLLNEILSGFHPSSYEHFVCSDFLKYLDRTFDSHIIAHGLSDNMVPVPKDFGYPHRYTENYIKGRFAKLYLLDTWYQLNPEMPMTFLTMTTRHKADSMVTLEESLTQGIRDSFKRLQKGWRLLMREIRRKHKGVNFMMVVEPHESGFPHYHMIIFASFTIDEQIEFRKFWEKWGIGSFEHGLDFDERPKKDNIKSLRNYLMKYMSKSFVDYSSKYGGVVPWTKEQLLFNAIAWKFGFRTWKASNELSKVMKYHPKEKVDSVTWYETVLNSDTCEQHVLWKIDDEKKQELRSKIDGYLRFVESVNFDGVC